MENMDAIIASLKNLKNLKQEDFEYILPTDKSIDNSVCFVQLVDFFVTNEETNTIAQKPTKIEPDGEGGITFVWSNYPDFLLTITILDDFIYIGWDMDGERGCDDIKFIPNSQIIEGIIGYIPEVKII
jgi:hypothetical protein